MRGLVIVNRRERESRATATSFPSIGGGHTTRRLSLSTAAVTMEVPVLRQAGGEVITKPGKVMDVQGIDWKWFIIILCDCVHVCAWWGWEREVGGREC